MMKGRKGLKLLAGVLALCFMIVMAGCGGRSSPKALSDLTKDDRMSVKHLEQFKANIPNMNVPETQKEALNIIVDKYISDRKTSPTLDQIYKEAERKEYELKQERYRKEHPPKEKTPEEIEEERVKTNIRTKIREYVNKYDGTHIDKITINPHLGTETENDYVVLVNLTWNVKNSGKLSKEMLDMYSSDMAAHTYEDLPEAQELCVFWEVPYLGGHAKISFERTGRGMAYTDQIFDRNFNK